MFDHQKVKLVWITPKAEEVISYCARVSNPANQENYDTAPKLLKYLVKNKHWSPFEMASMCLEIETTRDIGRQILRHRSFSFQEFSQRYAEVQSPFVNRETRFQDSKNRQNSVDYLPGLEHQDLIHNAWHRDQHEVQRLVKDVYDWAIGAGVAKEQARAILPEGMTMSRMYMSGTIRSWIHFVQVREEIGVTQKEHVDIARKAKAILIEQVPALKDLALTYDSITVSQDDLLQTIQDLKAMSAPGHGAETIQIISIMPDKGKWTINYTY